MKNIGDCRGVCVAVSAAVNALARPGHSCGIGRQSCRQYPAHRAREVVRAAKTAYRGRPVRRMQHRTRANMSWRRENVMAEELMSVKRSKRMGVVVLHSASSRGVADCDP